MPEFNLEEMLEAVGATAKNLSDGVMDDGDIEVLEWAKGFLEELIREGVSDKLENPIVKKILMGIAVLIELGLSDILGLIGGDDE